MENLQTQRDYNQVKNIDPRELLRAKILFNSYIVGPDCSIYRNLNEALELTGREGFAFAS